MFGDGADAPETARVLVGDEPIAPLGSPFGNTGTRSLKRRAMKWWITPRPTPARNASS